MTGRLSPDRQDEGTWTALPDIGDRAARGTTRNRPSAVATVGITARYGARTFISPAQVALAGGKLFKKTVPTEVDRERVDGLEQK